MCLDKAEIKQAYLDAFDHFVCITGLGDSHREGGEKILEKTC